jgi:hypothetical protein
MPKKRSHDDLEGDSEVSTYLPSAVNLSTVLLREVQLPRVAIASSDLPNNDERLLSELSSTRPIFSSRRCNQKLRNAAVDSRVASRSTSLPSSLLKVGAIAPLLCPNYNPHVRLHTSFWLSHFDFTTAVHILSSGRSDHQLQQMWPRDVFDR